MTDDWVSFPNDVVGSSIFRVTHQVSLNQNYAVGYLAAYFPLGDGGARVAPWRKLLSVPDPVIVGLNFPTGLLESGSIVYTLQAKARGAYSLINWTVEVEAFYPD